MILKILIFSLLIFTVNCEFPSEPLKQRYFDWLNAYTDQLNGILFNINGNMQSRFDNNVATLWSYWRSAQIFANVYGFALAGDNRTDLTDCLSSFNELIHKVIDHLDKQVMKPIFDIKNSNTKIEDDLASQFDEIKDAIFRVSNLTCMAGVQFSEGLIAVAYQDYRNFIATEFNSIIWRTGGDYASRFNFDFSIALRHLINLRSAIMTARTRSDLGSFVKTYCKPAVFSKFEKLIDVSNDVINGCSKAIYDALNEAIEKLPQPNPFISRFNACL